MTAHAPTVAIAVRPIVDQQDIYFGALHLRHVGCGTARMEIKRDVATNDYRLGCACGLLLVVANPGVATEIIMRAAITAEPGRIEAPAFQTEPSFEAVQIEIDDTTG